MGPDGTTPHSWRVEILPELDQKTLFDQYNLKEPWDSPANKAVLEQMPDLFRSPYDDPKSTNSAYFAAVGPQGVFDGVRPVHLGGILEPQVTLLLVEAKRDIPWTKPEDLEFAPNQPLPAFGGFVDGQFAIASADFAAHELAQSDDANQLRLLLSTGQRLFSFDEYNRQHPTGTPDERRTKHNLQRIARAILKFADHNHGRLPPSLIADADGRPPRSWRIELLPYLERQDLYEQYRTQEPWDSPANKRVLEQMPEVYRSPFDNPKSTNSGYFAVVGPRAAIEQTRGVSRGEIRVPHKCRLGRGIQAGRSLDPAGRYSVRCRPASSPIGRIYPGEARLRHRLGDRLHRAEQPALGAPDQVSDAARQFGFYPLPIVDKSGGFTGVA
jgi:hypothetical protein